VHSGAKPLFFSLSTDRAAQVHFLRFDYFTENAGFSGLCAALPEAGFCTVPDALWESR
jgi:hypothetical protein